MVSDPELEALLSQGSPSVAVWNLIERANQNGGKDNITAFVLHVADIQPWPEDAGGEAQAAATEPEADQPATNGRVTEPVAAVEIPAAPSHPASEPASPPKAGILSKLFGRA
jgi:hypothetical protein